MDTNWIQPLIRWLALFAIARTYELTLLIFLCFSAIAPCRCEAQSADDVSNQYRLSIYPSYPIKGDLSGGSPATYIDGIDDRGQRQRSVIFFGDFSRCQSKTPKHLPPGASYTTCLTYLIPGGGSIVGMRWVVFDRKTGKSDLNWR